MEDLPFERELLRSDGDRGWKGKEHLRWPEQVEGSLA